tara:strand:+ start:58 stop:801 length:744 start_codon:yes stop_codon:yes gene_type:complete
MIKFEVDNQSIEIDVEKLQKYKKIGIAFSSGTDSSLIFCLLAKYVPNIEIIPWYGIEFHQLPGLDFVKDAHKKIVNNYPNANIAPMRYFGIDKKDPIWIKKFENSKNNDFLVSKNIKNYIVDEAHNEYLRTGITNLNVFGTLSAPPKSECIKYNFIKYVQPYRFNPNGDIWSITNTKIWQPLKFVNKKFVAGMFKKEGLMDWLYSHLNSCAGRDPVKTKNFTYPCKTECFQCHERKWAFGSYDGGII